MMAPFMLFRYLTWLTIVACLFVNFVGFGYWIANWKSECAGGLELELAFEFHLGLNCFKIKIFGILSEVSFGPWEYKDSSMEYRLVLR